MSDEVFSHDGRINLPPPSEEALKAAAEDVLGKSDEAFISDRGTKLFTGTDGFYLKGPDEDLGTRLDVAPREAQDELMKAASKVRKAQAEEDHEPYLDPSKNPLIKMPD